METMSYLREDRAKIRRQLTQEAIDLAMAGRWEEAVAINREILESFPTDADSYNRLGRALMELGRYAEARGAYRHTLKVDPYNSIARKNLSRLQVLPQEGGTPQPDRHRVVPQLFIGETAKAGIVALERTAPREILARLAAGDEVSLRVQGQRLLVEDRNGVYLGEVEPRHSLRLIRLIEGGNHYAVAIASMSNGQVKVIIREVYQHPAQMGRLSFPPREAEAFHPVDTHYEEEEEAMPLDEGEEEPLSGVTAEVGAEAGQDDWENLGD